MRYLLSSVVLMGLVVGCSQSSSEPTTASDTSATANTLCPIMGGEVVADGGRTEWNGTTVGFCCPDCLPKWDALSDEETTEKLASAGHDHADTRPHGEHDHS